MVPHRVERGRSMHEKRRTEPLDYAIPRVRCPLARFSTFTIITTSGRLAGGRPMQYRESIRRLHPTIARTLRPLG